MKLIHIISGVLLLLLIAANSASAAEPVILTGNNVNPGVSGFPPGAIKIEVTYDGSSLTYKDSSPTDNSLKNGYATGVWIKEVAYNTDTSKERVLATGISGYKNGALITTNWPLLNPGNMDGFGSFYEKYSLGDDKLRPNKVVVNLPANTILVPNDHNVNIALHIGYEAIYNAAGQQVLVGTDEGKEVDIGSSIFVGGNAQIPEFPTIALPVTAILGLMFIIQRRKEN